MIKTLYQIGKKFQSVSMFKEELLFNYFDITQN
jgi:hypothetical protein